MTNKIIKVLYIEDNPGDARLIEELLRDSPKEYQFTHSTGFDTLPDLSKKHFTILLLDLHLEGTSGIKTFKIAKQLFSDTPIIVLTGLNDEKLSGRVVKEGAHDYLVKGMFDVNMLDRSIRYSIDRKHHIDELIESELRFRNLADTAPMYIAMADKKGDAVYFNRPWLEFTGMALEDIMGLGWLSVVHPDDAPKFRDDFAYAFKKKLPINSEYRFRRYDGEFRWMLAVGAPRYTPDGQFTGYFGTYTDFHELKQSQLAREESERRYRMLFNSIDAGFCVVQMLYEDDHPFDYRFLEVNSVFEKQTGLKNVIGKTIKELAPNIENDWIEIYGNVASSGTPHRFENTSEALGRVFEVYAYRFGDPDEQKVAILFTDITAKKENEKQHEIEQKMKILTEERNALLRVNKTKNEFISLASHQLRTPATAVKQYVGLLLNDFAGPLTQEQRTYLDIAYKSNERELNIINDLLKTAQLDASEYRLSTQEYDLVSLVKECISDMKSTYELKNQKVKFTSSNKTIKIPIDVSETRLAFINLLENASKYSYENSDIKVKIKEVKDAVVTYISDQGVGIGKENQKKVFEKFTRIDNDLSDTVTGTGLGLYWVKSIISLHKGTIELKSEPGKGSTFSIYLPKS